MKIIDTGKKSAVENMRRDALFLQELSDQKEPLLHFYDWEGDSLTYGYFIRPEKFLDLEEMQKRGISLAKRPTGGGIVFHIWDLAFSFLMPSTCPKFSLNPLSNYQFVNQVVLRSVQEFLKGGKSLELTPEHFPKESLASEYFCMARPTKYDVVLGGLKIAGAAQRLTKAGYLHQGTISLAKPQRELLLAVLKEKGDLVKAMENHTFCPLGQASESDLQKARSLLKAHLSKQFQDSLQDI